MRLKFFGVLVLTAAVFALAVIPALADGQGPPAFGELYYDGEVVRTVVPPAAAPKTGKDNLYVVPNQRAVAAVAPGDKGYHGGKWAVHTVTWEQGVTPYELTSEAAVRDAEAEGKVTIVRVPGADFEMPYPAITTT